MIPPTMVVSTTIWLTHPLVSIVPHGHVCSRVSLHRVLIVLFSLFHWSEFKPTENVILQYKYGTQKQSRISVFFFK